MSREKRLRYEAGDLEIIKKVELFKKYPEMNFKQSPEYGKVNEKTGHKVIIENFGGLGHAMMVVRDAKRGRYLEIPCGPLVDWQKKVFVKKVFDKIVGVARAEKCVFVRVRPQLLATPENIKLLSSLGLRPAPMPIAPENTVILDLTKSEEELLAQMRRQTRYEVRQAEKKEVVVEASNSKEIFEEFCKVQAETAKRQNFVAPNKESILAICEEFGENAKMYCARTKEGEKIAYGLFVKYEDEVDYYEAASTLLNRKLPGAYAVLWEAIKDAKKEGCKRFDFWGIAPKDQPNHRYAGVTMFKTGFGGEVIEYVPTMDLVIDKIKYKKNLIVEVVRKKRRHL